MEVTLRPNLASEAKLGPESLNALNSETPKCLNPRNMKHLQSSLLKWPESLEEGLGAH